MVSAGASATQVLEQLKPNQQARVIDLVQLAGVDVTPWATSSRGPVETPASNPAYCYEWSFVEPDKLVVLNLWHEALTVEGGQVVQRLNLRELSEQFKTAADLTRNARTSGFKRALRMDKAIALAFGQRLPVRVVVGTGDIRDLNLLGQKKPSRMKLRLLDAEHWAIAKYDEVTGECILIRGAARPPYVDQFSDPQVLSAQRREVTAMPYVRSEFVREQALSRAKGICEYCRKPGFQKAEGGTFLETHHVVPLSEGGPDLVENVAALCPNHHREAHLGTQRDTIKLHLQQLLADAYLREHGGAPIPSPASKAS
jgi:hypothetical protein